MHIPRFVALLATGAWLLSACGDDKKKEEDPVAEACEHLKDPPVAVTAAAVTATTTIPSVAADHKRYEVTLPSEGTGKQGVVKFSSTMKGEMTVFLSADIPLTVETSTGAGVGAEGGKKTTAPCTELKAWYVYDVDVGTYNLILGGPTSSTASVGLVIEAGMHMD
jgi:hypothetical protein